MAEIGSLEFPPVTKAIVVATAAVTLPTLMGLLPYQYIPLMWNRVFSSFEIWRPVTAFLLIGPRKINTLFDAFCMYQTSLQLEKDMMGDTAAYAWMLIVLQIIILAFNAVTLNQPFLFKSFLNSILYIWTKNNPTMRISIFGLIQVPARLYPLALVALDLVTGGPVLGCMLGLLAGHLYWFATTYLPTQAPPRLRRANPFAVPAWFRRHFPRGSVAGFSSSSGSGSGSSARTTGRAQGFTVSRPEGDDAAAAVRHRWGSGQKLGGERL